MAFSFIYGQDDYLVGKAAATKWAEMSKGLDPEWGLEVIDARAQKVEEAVDVLNRFRSSAQTVGLFGGGRAVWLRNVNFLAATITGQAEGTTSALEEIKGMLEAADGVEVRLLISASPIDKRFAFFKWATSKGECKEVASLEGLDEAKLGTIARPLGLTFTDAAAEMFLKKVGSSARAVEAELEKLSVYHNATADKPAQVDEDLVRELTSLQAEGEFFEPLEAFYSRRPSWALASLRDYFSSKDASSRPLIAAFMNRNRLLLMIRAAIDSGIAKPGYQGLSWSGRATALKAEMGADKTPFNLFGQNPWYLGKLAVEAARFTLAELSSIQEEFPQIFLAIHSEDEAIVFERFFLRHLPVAKAAAVAV